MEKLEKFMLEMSMYLLSMNVNVKCTMDALMEKYIALAEKGEYSTEDLEEIKRLEDEVLKLDKEMKKERIALLEKYIPIKKD